jgi:hypothetical protein
MSTSNGARNWRKALIGAAVVAALGAAGLVVAHPGAGFGPGGFGPGFMQGMGPGMGPGMMMRGGFAGPTAAQQLMTPEEQQAFIEKMQNAKTPEERQKLAEANRAEMEKRAQEKGITLPEAHGPFGGTGPGGMVPGGMGPGMMMRGMGPGAAGFRGPMGGPNVGSAQHDDAFAADMGLVHEMLGDHDRIKRTVTNLPNGISTVTESDDPRVAQTIKAHVASMEQRLKEGRVFNLFSPTLPVLFANKDKIQTKVETTGNGTIVTQTSDDPAVVTALQAHAVEVSELARDGMVAMMRSARESMGMMARGPNFAPPFATPGR